MSGLSLDGGNRIVATEFIKLLNTGTSNLATESYVDTAVANGGGSGGTSTTDLSGYYNLTQTNTLLDTKYSITQTNTLLDTKYDITAVSTLLDKKYSITQTNTLLNTKYSITQTNTLLDEKYSITQTNTLLDAKYNITAVDTLLDTKLNINNPQDMNGTLRIGHITGTSKIILNAVSSTKDFYVNGDAQVLGNLTVSSLDSTGYINVQSIQTNAFNALNTNDILFQSNNDTYLQYDVSTNKIIASKSIQCGGNLTTQEIDTIAPLDMILKVSGESILELKTDDRIVANKEVQCGGNLKTQEIDTIAPLDLIIKRGGVTEIEVKDNETQFNGDIRLNGFTVKSNAFDTTGDVLMEIKRHNDPYITLETDDTISIPKVATFSNNILCNDIITCDNFDSRSGSTVSNYIMNESTGEIKFYVGSPVSPDTTTNLVMTLQNNQITFHKPTSPEIGAGTIDDSNYVKKSGETAQLILGSVEFQGLTTQAYKFAMGGPSVFAQYRKFEIYNNEVIAYQPFKCTNNLGIQTNVINSFSNVDLVFQRNSIEYMKFTTSATIDINDTVRLRSNIYDSVDNADVSFRRNFIDFFYLRNNEVELASAIGLNATSAKIDTINTKGDNDMVLQRNGVEFLRLDGASNIVNVATGRALSSNYSYCNYLRTRTPATNDLLFEGANTSGNGYTEFMRLRKDEEDVMLSKDVTMLQEQRLYLSKTSGQEHYIYSRNVAGAHHIYVSNEDPNGDIRFFTKRNNSGTPTLSVAMYITPTKVSVPPPYTLEGDLVDTSDKTKKYDIKSIEHNFTDIVKQIEPKTFKMEEEKEVGITKNHIGFIADEIKEVIPDEWGNIVMTDDEGIKKLSYVKLSSILWGVCREQQTKIEWLESSVYELQEAVKALTKPNAKAKSKSKTEK